MNARKEDCYDGPLEYDERTAEQLAKYPPPGVDVYAYFGHVRPRRRRQPEHDDEY